MRTILLAALVTGLVSGCSDSDGKPEENTWASGPGAAVTTDDPATTFAPLIVLHPREIRFPISADAFITNATVKWLGGSCKSYENVAVGDRARVKAPERLPEADPSKLGGGDPYRHRVISTACLGDQGDRGSRATYAANQHTRPYDRRDRPAGLPIDQGFYLELLTAAASGERKLKRVGSRRFVDPELVPAYYETAAEQVDGRPGLRVTYWLLYGRNTPTKRAPTIEHEGDWERVGVLLARAGRDSYTPVSLRYYAGERSHDLPWGAVKRVPAPGGGATRATHPVLFAALGTHTPFPTPGTHRTRALLDKREVFGKERAADCVDCVHWQTWKRALDARKQPWYGFGGGWGATLGSAEGPYTMAPLGPSRYTRNAETVE